MTRPEGRKPALGGGMAAPGGQVIGSFSVSGNEGWGWSGTWGGRFFGNDHLDPTAPLTCFAGSFGLRKQ